MARVPATPGPSRDAVAATAAWLRHSATQVHLRRAWLTDLDAAIGDGDHGINLDRGFRAVIADLDAGAISTEDVGSLLQGAGRRLLGLVGGASGALYGRALMAAGSACATGVGRADAGGLRMAEITMAAAVDGIAGLGHAVPGDKTMLDALVPALLAIRGAVPDEPIGAVLARAAEAAEAGALATIPMVARKGRASYLGERSIGHMDPGAASSAMLVRSLAKVVMARRGGLAIEDRPVRP